MEEMSPFIKRKSTRIQNFDYSSANYYFVTICTQNKRCMFGEPDRLNFLGETAKREMEMVSFHYPYVEIDNFVIMPNHVHAIVVIQKSHGTTSLNSIIGSYKSGVSRKIRKKFPEICVWQRSFQDHVICDQSSYEKIWNYVTYNSQKWEKDCFYQADTTP